GLLRATERRRGRSGVHRRGPGLHRRRELTPSPTFEHRSRAMKRNILRTGAALAAGALAVGLAGCGTGGNAGDAELSDEPVTLRMYWWGGDNRHERTQQAIDLFEDKYPNITVEPEFADWTGYWEKLATSTAGKNMPDVIQMDQLYLASYADRGTLVDLTDYDIGTDGMEESVLGMGGSDGGLYAIPISTSAMS